MNDGEKRVVWVVGIGLLVSTLLSTVLHLAFPWVLQVPSNDGIPFTSYPAMFLLDLVPIALAAVCFHHAWRTLGPYRAMIFLGGSFFFTGLEESLWILMGRFLLIKRLLLALNQPLAGWSGETYYFTRGFFWWLETPLMACLSWFFIAYSCVYAAGILMPKARLVTKAALGGFLAMDLDLWLDPVQVHAAWKSWIWLCKDNIQIFSISVSNFIGWFLLIFLFAIVFEYLPNMVKRWGPGKATVYFYCMLVGLELCVLTSLMLYGAIAKWLFPVPINLTLWGL